MVYDMRMLHVNAVFGGGEWGYRCFNFHPLLVGHCFLKTKKKNRNDDADTDGGKRKGLALNHLSAETVVLLPF